MQVSEEMHRYAGSLDGKVAVVTGGGSGIGRSVAQALARSGADVALVGRRADRLEETAELIRSEGRRAFPAPADVADPQGLQEALLHASRSLGPPDVSVAAAGVNAWGHLSELSPETLRRAMATNVEGVANLARAVVPGMKQRGGGKFIVVASDNGRRPEPGGSGYVASKFGAVGFSLALSQELYDSAVSVHVVEPGSVDTAWYPPQEEAPRERMLSPDDVALVVLFLVTLPPHVILEEVMALPRGLLVEPWT